MPPARTTDRLAQQRRAGQALAAREALIYATLAGIADRGYHGCALADLAEAAGLSKNHIFHHFGSKERLVQAAVEQVGAVWRNEVATAAQMFPQPQQQLAHCAAQLEALEGRGWAGMAALGSLTAHRGSLPLELQAALRAVLDNIDDFFRTALKVARKSGLQAKAKPRQLAGLFAATLLSPPANVHAGSQSVNLLASLLLWSG